MYSAKIKTVLLATAAIFLAGSLMVFPKESLEASIRGMTMWWDIVFPSLLPFFIVSELLIGFGVVTFIGAILEPLMRPLFRVPGVGGFVWAMGLASGNPAGAKLTARLRQEGKVSQIEAERLVSFTNSSNPLFIFGAIAVGFFHNPALGIVLALAHYLGNICVGLLFRFHGRQEEASEKTNKSNKLSVKEALRLLHKERLKDGRPIGQLLGDAVQSSVKTLLMIGGFIILFSVLNQLLILIGITSILAVFISIILTFFKLPSDLSIPFISGIFEITLGAKKTSESTETALLDQIIITSFFLAFSGFSIQAQVASILAETDIRFKPFFVARIIHGFFAAFIALLLWEPLYVNQQSSQEDWGVIPVFLSEKTAAFHPIWELIVQYGSIFTLVMLVMYILLRTNQALK
ncbi:sporulation integral membrane protein YlbJ [Alkalihalophilus lindianensis]|uniref:Sporulation integral membrane protein YlbJ n=1 Tax=Alkalihalophilus lindianensis TaxID=1630542 RepID=A0ABU3XBP6_9BACI|nr:sporulation integral membrane protein YlbJ [Alkalihalophilus lindianensis]MDV2685314.1 sporulation integral membrane protein YlbJ [Alkalihalophilus lindianensis]